MFGSSKTYAVMIMLLVAAVIIGGCENAQTPTGPADAPNEMQNAVMSLKTMPDDIGVFGLKKNVAGRPCGDLDEDNRVTLLDFLYLNNYLYEDGPAPIIPETGDVNGDCSVDVFDLIYLVNYVLFDGPPPVCPQDVIHDPNAS